jgi:hypothetical protein
MELYIGFWNQIQGDSLGEAVVINVLLPPVLGIDFLVNGLVDPLFLSRILPQSKVKLQASQFIHLVHTVNPRALGLETPWDYHPCHGSATLTRNHESLAANVDFQ